MSISLKLFILIITLTPFVTESRLGADYFHSDSSLLKLVVSGIGLLIVLLLFLAKQSNKNKIVFSYIKALIPAGLFVIWSGITLFWVSDYLLATELLMQFFIYVIALFLIINLITNINDFKKILTSIVISLVGVSIIGLLQYYFPENQFIQTLFLQTAAPGSTFVNKNMASHFVVMTLPISIVLLLMANSRFTISLYGIATATGSWFLIYTVARQAYLAIFAELLILILFLVIDYLKNKSQSTFSILILKKEKYIVLSLIAIFLVFISNVTNTGWSTDNAKLQRVQNISVDGGNSRFPAWANTLEMIKDNPLTGVGIGQWSVEYPLYYDRSMKDVIFNEKTRAKKLHNDYLETFANVGFVGFSLLIWLAFLVINKSWGILKNPLNQNRMYFLSVTLGMVGFSVVALFSFPIGVYFPALLLFVYIGLLWFDNDQNSRFVVNKNTSYFYLIVALLIMLISVYSYKHLQSKHYVRFINEATVNKSFSHDYNLLTRAIELMPSSWIVNQSLGRLLLVNGQPHDAIPYLEKARLIKPYHSFTLLNLAQAYEKSEQYIDERRVLESLVSFDQRNVRGWGRLVQIYVKAQDKIKANSAYKNMKINFEYFKNRSGFGPYHDVAIGVSKYVSDYRYTKYIYDHLIDVDPSVENYVAYGEFVYVHLKDKSMARGLFLKAKKLDPVIKIPLIMDNDKL